MKETTISLQWVIEQLRNLESVLEVKVIEDVISKEQAEQHGDRDVMNFALGLINARQGTVELIKNLVKKVRIKGDEDTK